MFFIFRTILYFALSFLALSIPYQGKPVFNHIHDLSEPIVKSTFDKSKIYVLESIKMIKTSSEKLYTNSAPIFDSKEDSLSFGASSISEIEEITDEYTPEEKELLQKILKEQGLK